MKTFIGTEGKLEAGLMERLVACHPILKERNLVVRPTGGRGSVLSLARTVLSRHHVPVAGVFSPETMSAPRIEEQRASLDYLIGQAGLPENFLVVLVPPDVAVLLFQDEGIINAVVPGPLSFEDRIRARYVPREVLTELYTRTGEGPFPEALLQRIARADLSALWRLEVLNPLEAFLLRVSQVREAVSPAAP